MRPPQPASRPFATLQAKANLKLRKEKHASEAAKFAGVDTAAVKAQWLLAKDAYEQATKKWRAVRDNLQELVEQKRVRQEAYRKNRRSAARVSGGRCAGGGIGWRWCCGCVFTHAPDSAPLCCFAVPRPPTAMQEVERKFKSLIGACRPSIMHSAWEEREPAAESNQDSALPLVSPPRPAPQPTRTTWAR